MLASVELLIFLSVSGIIKVSLKDMDKTVYHISASKQQGQTALYGESLTAGILLHAQEYVLENVSL